jgi:DNA-binding winged helix-turn-helix (wHTH) protein/tetratricopeptide (TPR) repeat protein
MNTGMLDFGEFRLDPANARLWCRDESCALAPKPFDVLCFLAAHPGELVTKAELLNAIWPNLHVTESSLTYTINAIRAALGDNAQAPVYIETVMRRGYRFIARVTRIPPEAAETLSEKRSAPSSFTSPSRPRWWVGRAARLEALTKLAQQAINGNRQVVFITGEMGIGKTTLVEVAVEGMAQWGVSVLWGKCFELFGTDEAFLPLVDALQEFCRGANGPFLIKALRDHAPTWLAQMPSLIETKDRVVLQNEVFGATRERMLREFCDLLEIVSSEHPWIVILEDLHWSDFATLDVLSRFARRDRRASVLVIVTYRSVGVSLGDHPIRAVHQELQIHGHCVELALDRLSLAEVEQHLDLRLGDAAIAQALAGRVFGRTGGQPLFVVALIDYLIAERALREVDGRWCLAAEENISQEGMPHGLRDIIAHQIECLTAIQQRILETASAAGAEFCASLAAAVLGHDIVEVETVCEGLARNAQGIVQAGMAEWPDGTVAGCYAFRHALYQDVLYQRLAPAHRVQTHRRIGERLEAAYGSQTTQISSVLALHFEKGRDFAKAVRYLSQAAENSAKRFNYQEAAAYLTRAFGLVDRFPVDQRSMIRITLLQLRGWVRRSAGELPGALADLRAVVMCAAEADLHSVEVKALVDLSRFCLWVDRQQCLELATRAVARSETLDDNIVKALVQANIASLSLYLNGWRDEDAALCYRAMEIVSDVQDPIIIRRFLGIENMVDFIAANYHKCFAGSEHGEELAQEGGDGYLYVLFSVLGSFSLLHLGEWRKLRERLVVVLAMAERNANFHAMCPFRLTVAWLHAETLDFQGAKECCEAALDRIVEQNPLNFFMGRILLARANIALHDHTVALAHLNAIEYKIEIDSVAMESFFYPLFHHAFCDYYIAIGDLVAAQGRAMKLCEICKVTRNNSYLALAHRLLAKIAIAEGDLEEAQVQLFRAIAIIEQGNYPLAAWRVYATAKQLHERRGEAARADEFRRRSEKVIQVLAENLDERDPLRWSLLAGFASFV